MMEIPHLVVMTLQLEEILLMTNADLKEGKLKAWLNPAQSKSH